MDKLMKKKDNRGMSLVEIIIVIALMMVIAGVTSYGISLISSKPVEECARKVEIVLNQNRTNSMGKKVAYLEFYMTSDGVAVRECSQSVREPDVRVGNQVIIGAADVNLRFVYKNAGGEEVNAEGGGGTPPGTLLVLGGDPIEVSFKRDNGALNENEHGLILDRIEVYMGSTGGGHVKTIKIDKLTGKVTLQ